MISSKERREYIARCEASLVDTVSLGGRVQKVAIDGLYKSSPVVIFLHGGPGLPLPLGIGGRGSVPYITGNVTVVRWDQYGCGMNTADVSGITISDMVGMSGDLVRYAKDTLPNSRIYLLGMSWGSLLCARLANIMPDLIDGVFTYGQITRPPLTSDTCANTILASKAPGLIKRAAEGIFLRIRNGTARLSDMLRLSLIVRLFTKGYGNRDSIRYARELLFELIGSPDYNISDIFRVFRNKYRKSSLIGEISVADATGDLSEVSVPYSVYQGEYDIVTDTSDMEALAKSSANSNISCKVLRGESHFPSKLAVAGILSDISSLG